MLSAGDLIDEITKKPDQMSDKDLKKIPIYAQFRDAGDDERTARDKYNQLIVGAKPAIAFVLGAGEGLFGPAAQLVRGAKGVARHGIGKAALEGGTSELADEGGAAILSQQADIQGGRREDYDPKEILDRGLTGMVLGAGLGGVSGIGGGHGKGKAKADEVRDARAGEEDAAVQTPAGQAEVAAGAESPAAKVAAIKAKAAEKNPVIAVDEAVKLALDEKTQPPATPQQPVEPPVPTPPPAAPQQPSPVATPPAAMNASQETVAQPQQQQPAEHQQTAAAAASPPAPPVTPEVTPADKPVITERMFRDLYDRGVQPDEAVRLTRQQIAEVMNRPAGAPPAGEVSAPPTQEGTSGATDISARARSTSNTPDSQAEPSAAPAPSSHDSDRDSGRTIWSCRACR